VVDGVNDEIERIPSAGIAVSGIAVDAALRVATRRPFAFDAIACRHARILSMHSLHYVRSATLFLAVAGDLVSIRPMTRAFKQLQCIKRFELVSGGSSGFEDEHSFRASCELTAEWMCRHIGRSTTRVQPPASQPCDAPEVPDSCRC
jgi:hypothetical protein